MLSVKLKIYIPDFSRNNASDLSQTQTFVNFSGVSEVSHNLHIYITNCLAMSKRFLINLRVLLHRDFF